VDVLIDKRELLEKARQRNLSLQMIEKDYVLGWLLFGVSKIPGLVFKGGTALSKIYFPEIWRLSEDLDFAFPEEELNHVLPQIEQALSQSEKASGIKFRIKSQHLSPLYLQLKIQYDALLGRNWVKLDVTKEGILDTIRSRKLKQTYSDYPDFNLKVESLEEIFAEKLRAVIERMKCRDYYDVWQLLKLKPNPKKTRGLFFKKCEVKQINFERTAQFFPPDLQDVLRSYWERELGRLVRPLPDLDAVLVEMRRGVDFLKDKNREVP
jgi:predicted nucleotidyltransferase component of viral defense system